MPTRDHRIDNFDRIRTWEGSQAKAFEQLCFQLRDPEPLGVKLRKTADPDGGFEWYWLFPDGHEEGWQAKFSFDEKTLISGMKASFTSVAKRRGKKATRITFCIPRDFADDPDGARGRFGWQRFDDAVENWGKEAPWIEVHLIQGGQLLERLAKDEHRGRQWFWFGQPEALDIGWCRQQRQLAIDEADDRYHPEFNVDLQVGKLLAAPAQPPELRARFEDLVNDLLQQVIRAGEIISGGEFEQAPAEVEKTAAAGSTAGQAQSSTAASGPTAAGTSSGIAAREPTRPSGRTAAAFAWMRHREPLRARSEPSVEVPSSLRTPSPPTVHNAGSP